MKNLVLHLIATIKYRFNYAIANANEEYSDISVGHGVRTPVEILYHMRGLMYYSAKVITGVRSPMDDITNWNSELSLFYDSLQDLSTLIELSDCSEEQYKKMTQGPLADALTHIGQLAMLSRINGLPLDKENFVHAKIEK